MLQHKVRRYSDRVVAAAAHVARKVVRKVKRGGRIRKSTARKIERALRVLESRN
jgi:hypothetical protein